MFYIQEKEKKIQRLSNKKKESKIFYKENKILYNYLNTYYKKKHLNTI